MLETNPKTESLFSAALAIESPEERAKYLDLACGPDYPLRSRVEELLAAYPKVERFLESPAGGLVATVDEQPVAEGPGTVIGPYKLLEQIGEGGFGVVFMAEQTKPVRRKVALKVLKPGMDTRQVIARFEAERQALALMDHTNIAKVLDAGQPSSGRPYFVMDLVIKGLPITEFSDQANLPIRERLELFVSVCQAVQHAHQKGIIHRDIKPSNVLVTRHDGTPVPKIIDFGIAKVLGQQLTDKTLHTGLAQLIGTPLYMAPEQAALGSADVDTRSDIYSLGVLLYELLTGTTPFDKERLSKADFNEIRRIIREEEPPRPSMRISTLGEAATTISTQRKSDPKQLSRLLHGELDWIVMKCLEKDRNRRYETASALAADVQHYLHDEPVQACPPSAWYKFRKFARRKKTALVIGTCVFLAFAGLAGGVGWVARDRAATEEAGARQAQEALTAARTFFGENRLDRARQKLAEAQALLAAHHVAPGSLAGEIEALEAELARFEQFFAWIDQAHQAEIPSPDEVALAGQGTGGTAAVPSRKPGQEREPAKAVPFLRKALALYEALGQKDWSTALEQGALGRDQVEQIRRTAYEELVWLADDVLARREDHVSGERLSAPAAARQALAYLDQAEAAYQPTTAFISLRARCRGALGDKEAADADAQLARATPPTLALDHVLLGQAALDAKEKDVAVREFEEALRLEPTHYWSLIKLGQSFNDLGEGPADFAAAVAVYTGCIMKRPDYAPAYLYRAKAHRHLKQYEKSLQDHSKAIELDPKDARSWTGRGAIYCDDLAHYDKALADFNKAIELDPKYAVAWHNRGVAYKRLRQYDKALIDGSKAIDLDPRMALAWASRGLAYSMLHQYDEALADYSKAIDLDPKDAVAWYNRGTAYNDLHQYEKALADFKKAIELDPRMVKAWINRGIAYNDLHQYEKALADLNKAIDLDPRRAAAWTNRGIAYNDLCQYEKAIADYSKAIELDPKHVPAWHNRGNSYKGLHRYDKALADLNMAIELDPGLAVAWNTRGNAYHGLHQYDKALADYSKAIELDPKYALAWTNRGFTYNGLHQYENALAELNKAIELDPKLAAAWHNRGVAYKRLRRYDKALTDFNKAIELDPKEAAAWINRGAIYCDHLAQYEKALTDFNKAIELDPRYAVAWHNRGVAYKRLRRYDKALADSSKAIELDPKYALAWTNRGAVYIDLHQYDKALADFNKAIELDPKYVLPWHNRGSAYNNLHQYDKALADFNKAIELDPKNSGSWNRLAWLFATCPDPRFRDAGKAVRFAQKAVELAPADGNSWNTLGAAHYRAGEWKLAVDALNKSMGLRKGGDSADWFFLAMAHWQLGDKEQAHKWFDQGVQWMEKNAPQNEELRRFRGEAEQLLGVNKKKM